MARIPIPNPDVPFLGVDGRTVSRPWWDFLQAVDFQRLQEIYDIAPGATPSDGNSPIYSAAAQDWTFGTPAVTGNVLPTGGTSGQLLKKNSGTNYDASWFTPPYLVSTNNLSDVGNVATARTNLGLGGTLVTVSGHALALGGSVALAAGDISGLGYFATGTDASNLTGTVADARLSANVALKNAANVFTQNQTAPVFLTSGAIGGFEAVDRTSTGNAVFYRTGQVSYLYDSVYGNALSYDQAGTVNVVSGVLEFAGVAASSGQIPVSDSSSKYVPKSVSGDGSLASSGALTITKTSGVAFGYFATGTDASNLTGTLADARLSTNVPLKNAVNVFTQTQVAPAFLTSGANGGFEAVDRTSTGNAVFYRAGQVTYLYDSVYGNAISYDQGGTVNVISGVLEFAGVAGSAGQVAISNSSSKYVPQTISGDASLSAAGALTVTKTSGVAFGYFATGTDASNLTGTLADARLSSNVPLKNAANTFTAEQIINGALVVVNGSSGFGIGYGSATRVQVAGLGSSSSTYAFAVYNGPLTMGLFYVRDDGWLQLPSTVNNTSPISANLGIDGNGFVFKSTSSARYKTNIQPYTRGLDALSKLKPVFFNSKDAKDTTRYAGFLAEDLHDAGLHEFVVYDKDGKPDAIHYPYLTALLVAAVQELTQNAKGI